MQFADQPSWRFSQSVDQALHAALYVRDAVGLDVSSTQSTPPKLDGAVPDRRAVLDDRQRIAATAQWPSWWQDVVAWTHRLHAPPDDPGSAWAQSLHGQLDEIGGPPDFAGLADRPELQMATLATYDEASDWPSRSPGAGARAGTVNFPHEDVQQIAEDFIFDRRVRPDEVSAAAFVLAVRGSWWQVVAPGLVLCSRAVLSDPVEVRLLLRTVFESGLTR